MAPREARALGCSVAGRTVTERLRAGGLRALATQVALALESAALTEEVHRRRGEARFASLVQHSSDLITVLGPDGASPTRARRSSASSARTPEEVVGTCFERPDRAGEAARLLRLVADGAGAAGASQAIECTLLHKDGGRASSRSS